MSTIQKLSNKNGVSYRVLIRKKGLKAISKTFSTKRLASQFALKLEFQGGSCALCQKPLARLSRRINIDHDHDHEMNEVRGLLCTGCNTGLGHLGDNIEGIERAIYYLNNAPYKEYVNAR